MLKLMVIRLHRACASDDNKIIPPHKLLLMQPLNLAQTAAQPVAVHRMAKFGADCQAHAVFRAAVFTAVEHEIRVGAGNTPAIEPAKQMILFEGSGKLHSCASFGTEP